MNEKEKEKAKNNNRAREREENERETPINEEEFTPDHFGEIFKKKFSSGAYN